MKGFLLVLVALGHIACGVLVYIYVSGDDGTKSQEDTCLAADIWYDCDTSKFADPQSATDQELSSRSGPCIPRNIGDCADADWVVIEATADPQPITPITCVPRDIGDCM